MKHIKLFLFIFILALAAATPAFSQDGPPPDSVADDDRGERRPNLFAELGLSPEQVQSIRRLNQARRPQMMDAQRRLREANRDLDISIYSDATPDAEFNSRLKEYQTAQAEVARLRFEGELSVRKVLTAEQLVRFRELRRRFAEARNAEQNNRRMRRRQRNMPQGQDGPPRRP
jgi:Spy/CpxP family protein refolding chaperone